MADARLVAEIAKRVYAVSQPRFHHQGMPENLLTYDGAFPPATLEALRQLGYSVQQHEWPLGDVQLIVRTSAGWDAASDPRGGTPATVSRLTLWRAQAGVSGVVADLIHPRIFRL